MPKRVLGEVGVEDHAELPQDTLVAPGRRCGHEQFAVDDLVSIPIVGKRFEHLVRPFLRRCGGHSHTLNSSAKGEQERISAP